MDSSANSSHAELFSDAIKIVKEGSDLTEEQTSDLIDAMLLFMDTADDHTGPINIGNPDEFTIKDIANKVINLTNSNSNIIYKPLPEDDPKQRKPDISQAKEKINWEPKINLIDGLRKTIEYFEKTL